MFKTLDDYFALGQSFAREFGRFEHTLKRLGFLQKKDVAQADWPAFARTLSAKFYNHIVQSRVAETLLNQPPRKLMSDRLTWQPANPRPLQNVDELFTLGVCRVRNNFIHGEKFVGGPDENEWERDATLVQNSLAVLNEAGKFEPMRDAKRNAT